MDILERVKSDNKAQRRNSLRQLLNGLINSSITVDNSLHYLQQLPFDDCYDTCRGLSYRIVLVRSVYKEQGLVILKESMGCDSDSICSYCFNKLNEYTLSLTSIRRNIKKNKQNEVEDVRIDVFFVPLPQRVQISNTISFLLRSAPTSMITNVLDVMIVFSLLLQDLYKDIDIYLTDSCNDVVLPIVSAIPSFIQRYEKIHYITEQLMRSLHKLLTHKNHTIRYQSIYSILLLFRCEIDRNEILFENYYSSFLQLLNDPYDDVQRVLFLIVADQISLMIIEFCLQKGYYKQSYPMILEYLTSLHDMNEENMITVNSILSTPLDYRVCGKQVISIHYSHYYESDMLFEWIS